jgi:hypothetical protein
MTRLQIEDFSDQEISRIFVAVNLKEAEAVESILSAQRIDYAVEIESYVRLSLFSSEVSGAVFYVLSTQSAFCRGLLQKAGYGSGVVEEDG